MNRHAPHDRVCPHCSAALGSRDPTIANRCPTCRLIIGANRSLDPNAGTVAPSSSAANMLIAQAHRSTDHMPVNRTVITRDLRRVATEIGVTPQRLRMLDYQTAWEHDQTLTSLGSVIGTFGSWKRARTAAATPAP